MNTEKLIEEISLTAREAGQIMLEAEDIRHTIKAKSGHANFVTAYDERVQEFLFDRLQKILPGAHFVGEEEGAEVFKPEYETGYTFVFTHRNVNEREEEYYYGTPIRAVFSID